MLLCIDFEATKNREKLCLYALFINLYIFYGVQCHKGVVACGYVSYIYPRQASVTLRFKSPYGY